MAGRGSGWKRNQIPRVDWWDCEECGAIFSTRADPDQPAEVTETEDCMRCDGDAILLVGDVPLV